MLIWTCNGQPCQDIHISWWGKCIFIWDCMHGSHMVCDDKRTYNAITYYEVQCMVFQPCVWLWLGCRLHTTCTLTHLLNCITPQTSRQRILYFAPTFHSMYWDGLINLLIACMYGNSSYTLSFKAPFSVSALWGNYWSLLLFCVRRWRQNQLYQFDQTPGVDLLELW